MDYKKFKEIQDKYGDCGSWAIWAEEGNKPKSNVGDISIFDTNRNPRLQRNNIWLSRNNLEYLGLPTISESLEIIQKNI